MIMVGAAAELEVLTRFGEAVESPEKLAQQAALAEANGFPHGVSVMALKDLTKPGSRALRSEVEKIFPVRNTGKNPLHRTIELPKPVTKEIADQFNRLFGRTP